MWDLLEKPDKLVPAGLTQLALNWEIMGAISIIFFMLSTPCVQDRSAHCLFSPRESKACKILETMVSRKQESSGLARVHLPGVLDDLRV